MEKIDILGIDLAKKVYQVHGVDTRGKCVLKRKFNRNQLFTFVANLPTCTIAMEACAGAQYFSRQFQQWGHEVKLIAPQFVAPYVQSNKNDAADAEAICEAASRPKMRFVSTKAVWQQDLQSIHRIRQRLSRGRTALMNEIRGILYEFGIVIAKGHSNLVKSIEGILNEELDEKDLSSLGKQILQELYSELLEIDQKIEGYEQRLKQFAKQHPDYKKLSEIRGMGLIGITAMLVALGDPSQFKNGRQFAAWIGLVPRHQGTGGNNRILGISKRGNPYLRSLLVHGARAQLQSVMRKAAKGEKLDALNHWVYDLCLKKGWNKACVALANKNARIAWALLSKDETFNVNKAAIPHKIAA